MSEVGTSIIKFPYNIFIYLLVDITIKIYIPTSILSILTICMIKS